MYVFAGLLELCSRLPLIYSSCAASLVAVIFSVKSINTYILYSAVGPSCNPVLFMKFLFLSKLPLFPFYYFLFSYVGVCYDGGLDLASHNFFVLIIIGCFVALQKTYALMREKRMRLFLYFCFSWPS